jgi:bacterioferritin-associated ferredoxin
LDVDKNGSVDALTDGLLLIRHMFGYRGDSLIHSALGTNCIRCTSSAIEAMLNQCAALAVSDIDGNGEIDALTDGLLNMRFIFGIRGNALINNSVGNNCSRCIATEIEAYLTEKATR